MSSPSYLSREVRLKTLHPDFLRALEEGRLSKRAAQEILPLKRPIDRSEREYLIRLRTMRRIRSRVAELNGREDLSYIREAVRALENLRRNYNGQDLTPVLEAVRKLEPEN